MLKFPFYKQYDEMDCGPTCLRMVCKYFKKEFSLEFLRSLTYTSKMGTSLLSLCRAAEHLGLETTSGKITYENLVSIKPFPAIIYWNQKHYVVVYKIKGETIYIADPAHGLIKFTKQEFLKSWIGEEGQEGILLCFDVTPKFLQQPEVKETSSTRGFRGLLHHVGRYKVFMLQLLAGLLLSSLLQLCFPYLTQSVVDIGIANKDTQFIFIVLLSQLMIFLGRTIVELFRNYILLHVSTRVNVNLLEEFFAKLMRLPLGFFDTKMIGDILQRINDHRRVENFLTSGSLNTVFSFLNLLIFGFILASYNPMIFLIFLSGSILYVLWILAFMKKRATLDYKLFTQLAANQENNYELIMGMQEIKLHNAEIRKRNQWQVLQAKLFKVNLQSLKLRQTQSGGAVVINELKNIFITFIASSLVVQGDITIGMMMSISYIIGQLNSPLLQIIEFIQSLQDAKLSLARINELKAKKDEENTYTQKTDPAKTGDIVIKNLCFKYDPNPVTPYVLENINLVIPANKITAIVGASGSGKTTLMKLLLKFYEPSQGDILFAGESVTNLSYKKWRDKCGAVMQEGFIFNDSIANNIALGEEEPDEYRIQEVAGIANIESFIESLPHQYQTKIGSGGVGLSTGQKQRLLIARALYKDPDILLFDEATSALDAKNEKEITNNLSRVFQNKTVIIIAHRLSTVRNADKIIVLSKGGVSEMGSHHQLVEQRGLYFNLVSNQLELGN
jgi:ATP-binding cassette subfamily B protein